MSDSSGIEWTDSSWQVTSGCTKVSDGCKFCYAEVMANRLAGMAKKDIAGGADPKGKRSYLNVINHNGGWNNKIELLPQNLEIPLRWKKPRKVFVNSMSDLFHKDVPFEFVDRVFAVMALTPQHTYQILTKRPERMAEYLSSHGLNLTRHEDVQGEAYTLSCGFDEPSKWDDQIDNMPWPLPNVWLGTSVENQEQADKRIPHLLKCPAAVRFLSVEPMLGPIDIEKSHPGFPYQGSWVFETLARDGIHWVICGGESGSGARPMHPQWASSLRDQCSLACVPFFFKQWGAWAEFIDNGPLPDNCQYVGINGKRRVGDAEEDDDACMGRVGKHAAGRTLDGRTWDEMPAIPTPAEAGQITTPQ